MKKEKSTIVNALVVDDNEVNILILANMLEVFGIHVDRANHGMKALHLTQKKIYDIIFIDHLMPEMDGIHTTVAIRNSSSSGAKTVIIALSSELSDHMRKLYRAAGANDIYLKPIGLLDLTSLLKQWCPKVKIDKITEKREEPIADKKQDQLKSILENMKEIDCTAGLIDVAGNPIQFINVLRVSLKDLQSSINIIVNGYANNSLKLLHMGTHKIKSIFINIGAVGLLEDTKSFEMLVLKGDWNKIHICYSPFLKKMESFKEKLQITRIKHMPSMRKEVIVYTPLSDEEYEQCLLNTIYYIRRFEYDAIIKELEYLILHEQFDLKLEYEVALSDVKNFQYEKALERIMKIKNEIGNMPIPENNKSLVLEKFWEEL